MWCIVDIIENYQTCVPITRVQLLACSENMRQKKKILGIDRCVCWVCFVGSVPVTYPQTSHISRILVGNKIVGITQMYLEHRMSALLQLHLHSRLNTWLQCIGQSQLQDEARNIKLLGFGAPYIKRLTIVYSLHCKIGIGISWKRNHRKTLPCNLWYKPTVYSWVYFVRWSINKCKEVFLFDKF